MSKTAVNPVLGKLAIVPVLGFVLSLVVVSVGGAAYMHGTFTTKERHTSDVKSVNDERKEDIKEIKDGIKDLNKKMDSVMKRVK